MTDQPSTQDRCPTCGSMTRTAFNPGCYVRGWRDPWHGSQDVEGASVRPGEEMGRGGISANDQREWMRRFGSAPAIEGDDASTTQEAEKARRKHAPRDGLDPDTICELDCGHSAMVYNNLRSDPTGWQTWCYTCEKSRTVTSARPWPKPQPPTQEAEKALLESLKVEPEFEADFQAVYHALITPPRHIGEASGALARLKILHASLRTQHTEQKAEIAQLTDRIDALQLQHTIDQDEIRALRRGRDGEGSPRNRAVR